ncbi:hypothetical protein [Geothrix fuzhouensis]|uniref:hypothetical protein n=1 Tax=Geothrix fuzhouensis TaxID=2966451 RepID=UPI00214987D5|nr:hypothetical protein [Geothrix fuzhouensis]
MSLRNLPPSERAFATFVLLAMAAFLTGGLLFTTRQERAGMAQAPAARPRLMAILEGVMAPNTSPAETAMFRTWVQGGAAREGFAPVEAIVTNNCASCHGPGGQFPRITSYEDLRPLAMEEASDSLYATIGARGLHLVAFPLVFLAAAVLYLRRTAWASRKGLMGASAVAVLFDMGQWWLRQGRTGIAWAPWAALVLVATTYLALTGMVLADLWHGSSEGQR